MDERCRPCEDGAAFNKLQKGAKPKPRLVVVVRRARAPQAATGPRVRTCAGPVSLARMRSLDALESSARAHVTHLKRSWVVHFSNTSMYFTNFGIHRYRSVAVVTKIEWSG